MGRLSSSSTSVGAGGRVGNGLGVLFSDHGRPLRVQAALLLVMNLPFLDDRALDCLAGLAHIPSLPVFITPGVSGGHLAEAVLAHERPVRAFHAEMASHTTKAYRSSHSCRNSNDCLPLMT